MKAVLSNNKTRRSSFDALDLQPEPQEHKSKRSFINICFLKVFIINVLMFIGIILFLIVLKNKKNEQIDLNLYVQETPNEIHIDRNYQKIMPNDENYVYVPIIGTNDIHGNFFPVTNEINYNNKNIKYKTGGLEYISKYINILKDEFGKDRILYLDSGDNYFESYSAKYFDGTIIQDYFHLIGLNATILGNHEFLMTRRWIEEKIKNAKYPILINNYQDITTKNKKGILGENQKNSHLFEIKLENGDIIKIGVIGLALNLGIDKYFYDVGRRQTWNDLSFQDYNIGLEEEAKDLRSQGANAIIILSHVGLNCTNHDDTLKLKMYDRTTEQSKCEMNSPILKLINNTKPGLFDAIIAGDMHNEVHYWIKDIPIMCTNGKGKNVNIMYLPFKKDENNKYILANKDIKIEGPLPACEKIFAKTENCEKIKNGEILESDDRLVKYFWHGKKIESDPIVKPLYKKYYSEFKKYKEDEVFKFIGFKEEIKVNDSGDSLIEKLFLDIMRKITKTDFSIVHRRMFHRSVHPGKITFDEFMRIIPYSGELCTTEVTGEELITIIKSVQTGKYAFQPTSGLKQTIKITNSLQKEVIGVEIYENGKPVPIIKDKIYKMASNSIVLSKEGFDDFTSKECLDIIRDKLNKNKVKCSENEINIELLKYFRNKKIVDLSKEVDTSKERIIIVNK